MLKASNHKNEAIKPSWETASIPMSWMCSFSAWGNTSVSQIKNIYLFMLNYNELDYDITHLHDNYCLEY